MGLMGHESQIDRKSTVSTEEMYAERGVEGKKTKQVVLFFFCHFFQQERTFILHWAEIQAIHERWGYSGRKPPAPIPLRTQPLRMYTKESLLHVSLVRHAQATCSSLSHFLSFFLALSPVSHLTSFPFSLPNPFSKCALLRSPRFLFHHFCLLTTARYRGARLIIIHVHIITFCALS